MTKRLVIDDARTFPFPEDTTFYCRNTFTAYDALRDHVWDEIYWDHDMGMYAGGDTVALARFITYERRFIKGDPTMYVHSSNPVGAGTLMSILEQKWRTKRLATSVPR